MVKVLSCSLPMSPHTHAREAEKVMKNVFKGFEDELRTVLFKFERKARGEAN